MKKIETIRKFVLIFFLIMALGCAGLAYSEGLEPAAPQEEKETQTPPAPAEPAQADPQPDKEEKTVASEPIHLEVDGEQDADVSKDAPAGDPAEQNSSPQLADGDLEEIKEPEEIVPAEQGPEEAPAGQESDEVKPVLFTVQYLNASGQLFEKVELQENEALREPQSEPELSGHRFVEWREKGSAQPFQFGKPIEKSLILEPVFAPLAEETSAEDPADEPSGAGEAEESEPVRGHVSISVRTKGDLHYGEEVTLSGRLEGFEGADIRLAWQSNENGEWRDISGADQLTYTFSLNENNAYCEYRLTVIIAG